MYIFIVVFLSPVLRFSSFFYLILRFSLSLQLVLFLPSSLLFLSCCFLLTRPHTVNKGYCISCRVTASSLSLHSRHGGHPAAPSLACWLQSERRGPVRAGRQHALPQHEAFVDVRLCLHLLLLHPVLPVSLACYLHLPQRCGL